MHLNYKRIYKTFTPIRDVTLTFRDRSPIISQYKFAMCVNKAIASGGIFYFSGELHIVLKMYAGGAL